jgi:hypothetical protein
MASCAQPGCEAKLRSEPIQIGDREVKHYHFTVPQNRDDDVDLLRDVFKELPWKGPARLSFSRDVEIRAILYMSSPDCDIHLWYREGYIDKKMFRRVKLLTNNEDHVHQPDVQLILSPPLKILEKDGFTILFCEKDGKPQFCRYLKISMV